MLPIRLLLIKNRASKLRVIRKGYKILKERGDLGLLQKLRYQMSSQKIKNVTVFGFHGANDCIEFSTRQFLISKFVNFSFNRAILYSIGANKHFKRPLPREWQNILECNGIKVNKSYSSLLWTINSFYFWIVGCIKLIKSIASIATMPDIPEGHVYFDSLSKGGISSNNSDKNIINWYFRWTGHSKNVSTICHNNIDIHCKKSGKRNVLYTDGLPELRGRQIWMYALYAFYLSFMNIFLLRIYGCFMLFEVIKYTRVRISDNNKIANDYLFNNSFAFLRPLWTYEMESKGGRILFYFYSTNNEPFQSKSNLKFETQWHLIRWPHYLVWDNFQAEFIKNLDDFSASVIIEVVGLINFSSSGVVPNIPLNSVAVFDVTPFRPALYMTLGASPEYYTYSIASQFLSDIQLVLDEKNVNIAHKMKRNHAFVDRRYQKKLEQLDKKGNYIKIHPDIDAIQVISKSIACISMPFTSTALMAKLEGKPSVYYDPSGLIQKDDRAAHGIPVLSNIDELEEWVKSIGNE